MLHELEERELRRLYGLAPEQLAWRRWCIANNCGGDAEYFRQEYPLAPHEAFLATGRCVFDKTALAAQLTEKGIFVVEAAKRREIAGAVTKDAYAYDLLAVALIALADAHGARIGEVHWLFDGRGALDVNSDKRAETISEVAEQMLQRIIGDAPAGRFGKVMLHFGLAERIGAGFAADPTIRLDRDGLDLLKKSALDAIKAVRRLPGVSTQKALKEHILKVVGDKTSVMLTTRDLPILACDPNAALPYGWNTSMRTEAPHDNRSNADAPDDLSDDAAALASAGMGTDEDYGVSEAA